MTKQLVAYYSYSGNTRALAKRIAAITAADIIELVPEKHYAFDYNTAAKEARSEIQRGYCPKLLNDAVELDAYDMVLIGSPNWFKTIAPPVLSFLRLHDFTRKMVVPFCSHGGGGFGEIATKIEEECAGALTLPGLAVSYTYDDVEVEEWLKDIIPDT